MFEIIVKFNFQEKIQKNNKFQFCYHILGLFYSIVDNDKFFEDKIVRLSYNFNEEEFKLEVVLVKQGVNKFVTLALNQINKEFSIKGHKLILKKLDYNTRILDFENFKIPENLITKNFKISFLTPTYVRNGNIYYFLPTSSRLIFSQINKFLQLNQQFNFLPLSISTEELKKFKKWLGFSVIEKKFNIHSQIVEIKSGKAVGVLGNIEYFINSDGNKDFEFLLNLFLKTANFTGIGSNTNLGCGKILVKY